MDFSDLNAWVRHTCGGRIYVTERLPVATPDMDDQHTAWTKRTRGCRISVTVGLLVWVRDGVRAKRYSSEANPKNNKRLWRRAACLRRCLCRACLGCGCVCVWCAVVGGGGAGLGGEMVRGVMRFWYWRRMRVESGCKKRCSLSASLLGVGVSTTGLQWQNQPGVGVCVCCVKNEWKWGRIVCVNVELKNEREKKRRIPHSRNKNGQTMSNWVVLMKNEKKTTSHTTCRATCLHRILGPACLRRWVARVCVCVEF